MTDPRSFKTGDTINMETPDGRSWTGKVSDVEHRPDGGYEITVTQAPPVDPVVLALLGDDFGDSNDLERWRCLCGKPNPGVTSRCIECGRGRAATS